MKSQHLSDEAVAAFADRVLTGHAQDRARRHAAECAECAYAVAVQREAIWALRAAPAPALPTGLLDRLRSVPSTTPVHTVPTTLAPDGSAMFAALGSAAAFVPKGSTDAAGAQRHDRNLTRPIIATVAAVAAAGVLAVGSAAHASTDRSPQHAPRAHSSIHPADQAVYPPHGSGQIAPITFTGHRTGR